MYRTQHRYFGVVAENGSLRLLAHLPVEAMKNMTMLTVRADASHCGRKAVDHFGLVK